MKRWFVEYFKPNHPDPLERGVEVFYGDEKGKQKALSFIDITRNKGYFCHLYEGTLLIS